MATTFRHLFSPIQMRGVTLANRLVNAPHGPRMVDPLNHFPTEQSAYYLAERAKGGVGLIVAGVNVIHATGKTATRLGNIHEDTAIPQHRMLTDLVHQYPPTKVFAQLAHMGPVGSGWVSKLPLWAPSAVPDPVSREVPHEMEIEDIDEIVKGFAEGAIRALSAGYDGLEVHAAHGFLLCSFMSPLTNKRLDEYGGSLENRLRLTYRVIDAIRERVDEDVPLGLRINADEFSDGGLELEDMKEIAQALEATGKIDYVSLSQGVAATQHVEIPEMSFPLGVFSPLHAAIREVLETTPVMTVARVNDPVLAEKILADGHADLICMARGLIADPELPNKAREGRLDDICICIACNVGCRGGPHRGMPATCLQNPAVGYEKELGIGTQTPTQVRKRVMVVGGGPGGLKAAEVAAERGHQVTLYEKNTQLGGQVLIAAKAPTRDEFAGCVRYLVSHLERLGVKVNPGVEVTAELVESQSPDAVVLATGSTPSLPSVPGIDSSNVFDTWQVLNQEAELGEKVLVVDGGECSWKFCTTADFIAAQGSQVEMITALPVVGFEIDANSRPPILQRLIGKGIVFSTFTALRAIDHGTVTLANVLTGEVRTVEADSVVFAWYHKANNSLYRSLKGRVRELYAVGDCVAPRKAIDAIREGFLVGRAL